MIGKTHLNNLRNAEHMQYMSSAYTIFANNNVDPDTLGECYDELEQCVFGEEGALAAEKTNEKVHEKNAADKYRDRLYAKLVSYVKSITYDDRDPRVESARAVLKVLRELGNPSHLAENAESAMITTLGNRLDMICEDVEAIGAGTIVTALMEANQDFIILEKDCRDIVALQQLSGITSVSAMRKQTDKVYRIIVNAINGNAAIPSRAEMYKNVIAEMNALVMKYNLLLAGRGEKPADESDIIEE